jgi:hypothetical protein
MAHLLDDPRETLDWANGKLGDLETTVNAYLATNPYGITSQYDSQARQIVVLGVVHTPAPNALRQQVADLCYSLRSSLDQLAFAMAGAGGSEPPRGTEFPIFHDARDFCALDRRSGGPRSGSGLFKIRGVTNAAVVNAIRDMQPYMRVDDPKGHDLWVLHELGNVPKHRKPLILGCVPENAGLGIQQLDGYDLAIEHVGRGLRAGAFQPGTELARFSATATKPNATMHMHLDATFSVALDPKGPGRGQPLIACLTRLRDAVVDVFAKLEPLI